MCDGLLQIGLFGHCGNRWRRADLAMPTGHEWGLGPVGSCKPKQRRRCSAASPTCIGRSPLGGELVAALASRFERSAPQIVPGRAGGQCCPTIGAMARA